MAKNSQDGATKAAEAVDKSEKKKEPSILYMCIEYDVSMHIFMWIRPVNDKPPRVFAQPPNYKAGDAIPDNVVIIKTMQIFASD
jgi:hypothetical protein